MSPASTPSQNSERAAVLLILAGPAGSGKSTLCDRLVRETGVFSRIVTSTTRLPREGERNHEHYHFLSAEEFDAKISSGAFLEWAWVHKKHRYGTMTESVIAPLQRGRSLVINIDVQGVDSFRKAAEKSPLLRKHMTTVYIDVPIPILLERLAGRGTDGQEEIQRRMRTAEIERLEMPKFDHVIVSSSREEDFQALLRVWQKARSKIEDAGAK